MDWEKLKAEYIAGGTSYRKLAAKYGVSFNSLQREARKHKWCELRKQVQDESTTKLVDSISSEIAETSKKLTDVADKLLDKISETLDSMPVICSQSIKHFTSALKDIKDIKGIKSDIDLREQEARIDKLRKDVGADKPNDGKQYGVLLMPPQMEKLSPPGEEGENDG